MINSRKGKSNICMKFIQKKLFTKYKVRGEDTNCSLESLGNFGRV